MRCAMQVALLVTVVAVGVGCSRESRKLGYEYMPDMARSPAYKSFSPNPLTRGGLTLQRPVVGTIPRGFHPFHYDATPKEAERAGRELRNPFSSTPEVLAEGKFYFETFCLICHGARGRGDGPLVPKIPNPPSYTSARVRAMLPGQIFHVITVGSGRMPSYASLVSPEERWKIVTYVRFLQYGEEQHRD